MKPDFAHTGVDRLATRDLRFLLEHFPEPGRSYEEIARLLNELPTTLESLLGSEYVSRQILERRDRILEISPFLLFSVLLRQTITERRNAEERRVINYLANLLSLFARSDRLYRLSDEDRESYEYLVDLIAAANDAEPRRRFLAYAHIGNYSLYLTGLFPRFIEHRRRYRRRPVDARYYTDLGRRYFQEAAHHPLAREYRLSDVFLRLALLFDHYRRALNIMASRYLALG